MPMFTIEEARRVADGWTSLNWFDPNNCPVAKAKNLNCDSGTWMTSLELVMMSSQCNPWFMKDTPLTTKLRFIGGIIDSRDEAIEWMLQAGLIDHIMAQEV